MQRVAFRMQLKPGNETEYRHRHQTLWPELQSLLKESGIREYSIFLDDRDLSLFGYLRIENPEQLETLRDQPVMKKWWKHMRDLMDCHPDNEPVSIPLNEVFYLP